MTSRGRVCSRLMFRLICCLFLCSSVPAAWTGLRQRRVIPDQNEVGEAAGVSEATQVGSEVTISAQHTVDGFQNKATRLGNELKQVTTLGQSEADDTFTEDGNTNFLIGSFPRLKVINYARLPDLQWRALVTTELFTPQCVAIDEDRGRLYISDPGAVKVVWYQLLAFDTKLLTDGQQHVAVVSMNARSIALDLAGNLWISGVTTPLPPIQAVDAIWKQSRINIEQASSNNLPIEPAPIWRSTWLSSNPSPLALDAFSLYYGNDASGKEKGSVVQTTQEAPLTKSTESLKSMADNVDKVYSVAVTPTVLFYGADGAIYGMLKSKSTGSCGQDNSMCTQISAAVKKPTAMLWDGDGSIFLADNGNGAVYSFAAGSASPHALEKLLDASDIYGLDIFRVTTNKNFAKPSAHSIWLLLCFLPALFAL